jgi:hypothetical protein
MGSMVKSLNGMRIIGRTQWQMGTVATAILDNLFLLMYYMRKITVCKL